jgi:TrpR-related protein YerC/YecD
MPKKLEKLTRDEKLQLMFDLIGAFTIVKKPKETAYFLEDLLTANEVKNLAKRLRIAKLLLSGLSQREVSIKADVCLATVNKVNVWMERGGDGFKEVINRLPRRWAIPKNLPRGPIEYHLPQAIIYTIQYGVARHQNKRVENVIGSFEAKGELDKTMKQETDIYYKKLRSKKSLIKTKLM